MSPTIELLDVDAVFQNILGPGLQCLLKFKIHIKLRTESLAYENGHFGNYWNQNYFMHSLDDIEISLRLSFEKAGIIFNCKISCESFRP